MIIQKPRVLVPEEQLSEQILRRIERYARVCYKSEDKITDNSYEKFLRNIVKSGHESVIEHEKITVMFITDRGVTHEIVRHRIASFSQESTRYCNYALDKFGNEITVIEPFFFLGQKTYDIWKQSCENCEKQYFALLESGASPQEARAVLPNSLKTEIVVTFNIREWRHFFKLRCSSAAHPQIKQVAIPLLLLFQKKLPILFDDLEFDKSISANDYARVILTDELFNPYN